MPAEPDWPEPDTGTKAPDEQLARFQAKLDYRKELAKAEQAEDLERLKGEIAQGAAQQAADTATSAAQQAADTATSAAQQAADAASLKAIDDAINSNVAAYHAALIEVSKSAIDRARTGADTVQKAAGSIATVYATILAIAFSVSEHPLPSRALVPAVLLGLAIALSTAYLAYLSKAKDVAKPLPSTDFETGAMRRSVAFIMWTRTGAMNRKYALRASVLALAFGVAALPAAFINFDPVNNDSPSLPAAPDWPSKPFGGDTELNKILYQAQVTEAAGVRTSAEPIADDGDDSSWLWICIGAIVLSLGIPAGQACFEKRHPDETPGDGDAAVPAPAASTA